MRIHQFLIFAALILAVPTASLASKPEFRAGWVTVWGNGILSPQEADETIRAAKEANLNALFIQVRKTGDAYYNSAYEPRGTNITGPADYDPLAYVIEKARAAGIEVHAWAVIFRVWSGESCPLDPTHVYNRRPDWLSVDRSGKTSSGEGVWLDPGNPEVRDYTVNVLMDIVSRYDIDGIHLDYIRYPGSEWGYSQAALDSFNKATGRSGRPAPGDAAWSNWRRSQVTETVRRIYQETTTLKPKVKVTAATIPWGDCPSDFTKASPYTKTLQDWRGWMKEGILDANVLMNYKDETKASGANSFRNWINGALRWRYDRHAYIGQYFSGNTQSVIRQIQASRNRGTHGIAGFSFNATDWRPKLVQALRSQVFWQSAAVPEMPWKVKAVHTASREAFNKGVSMKSSEEGLDEAIALFSRAIELDRAFVDAHFRLGRCYLRKGMYAQAAVKFQHVLHLAPGHEAAQTELDGAAKRVAEADEDLFSVTQEPCH